MSHSSSALVAQAAGDLGLDAIGGDATEVDGLQRQHRVVLDMLGDPAAGVGREAGPQCRVATLHLRQGTDQRRHPQGTAQAQRQELVPEHRFGADLRQRPDAALGLGQRPTFGRGRARRGGRCHHLIHHRGLAMRSR